MFIPPMFNVHPTGQFTMHWITPQVLVALIQWIMICPPDTTLNWINDYPLNNSIDIVSTDVYGYLLDSAVQQPIIGQEGTFL